jgi:ADP-glucose pyrophosphorylase
MANRRYLQYDNSVSDYHLPEVICLAGDVTARADYTQLVQRKAQVRLNP